MRTCGNLDGKPCEWIDTETCERASMLGAGLWVTRSGISAPACAPMLSLVECRAERDRISRIKRQVRKAKKLGATVNVEALPQDGKIAHAVNGAVVAILEDCTGWQTEERLTEIATADPAMLQKQSKGKLMLALGVGRE